jgi:putative transposase
MKKSRFTDGQIMVTQWLWQYNNERLDTAIGGIPPTQLLQAG